MTLIARKIFSFFESGDTRTQKVKKNILVSLFLSGVNILSGLLIVPITLQLLGQEKYGIWLTIASLLMWFDFFDVGIGNGLRNKLGIAVANGNFTLAKKYVSTTYTVVLCISLLIILVSFPLKGIIKWSWVLNASPSMENELSQLFIFLVAFFSLKLLFRLITSVLYALQMSAWCDLINTSGKLSNLLLLYFLSSSSSVSLLDVALIFGLSAILFYFLFSLIFFGGKLSFVSPSFRHVELSLIRELMSLGGKFFLLQISSVFLYSSNNFIISHLFSPAEVAPYYVTQSYFGVFTMLFTIIVQPLWSATTDAITQGDYLWVNKAVNKFNKIWCLMQACVLIMALLSPFVYHYWLKGSLSVPLGMTVCMSLYTSVQTFSIIYVNFINGTGKVRLQMIYGIVGAVLNVPLCILFVKGLNFGPEGVVLSLLIYQFFGLCLVYFQYKRIMNNSSFGIWNK